MIPVQFGWFLQIRSIMSNTDDAIVAGLRGRLTGQGRAGICSVSNDMGFLRRALGRRYE